MLNCPHCGETDCLYYEFIGPVAWKIDPFTGEVDTTLNCDDELCIENDYNATIRCIKCDKKFDPASWKKRHEGNRLFILHDSMCEYDIRIEMLHKGICHIKANSREEAEKRLNKMRTKFSTIAYNLKHPVSGSSQSH